MVNCTIMTASPQPAHAPTPLPDDTVQRPEPDFSPFDNGFDQMRWDETQAETEAHGAGGRQVLGWALTILAILWTGYSAWQAGRSLAAEPMSSPAFAQWFAIAAGPLALLGLVWLMFGRTRRRETERFTRSVVALRTEARSLEALLEVLGQRINDSRSELTMIAQHLMNLGDQATGKLSGITREFDASTERLTKHGEALDRAAESARNDMAVLLDDLPRAEATATSLGERLRAAGAESTSRAEAFSRQVETLSERSRLADETIAAATERLTARLNELESAGAAASARLVEADAGLSGTIDNLLTRTATVLDDIRSGVDAQAAAVAALVDQASAGINRAGVDASAALGANLANASGSLDGLSARVAEQERASQRMIAEIDRGLTLIDERFTELAEHGDERANHFLGSLSRARAELDALAQVSSNQDSTIDGLADRTVSLRENMDRLVTEVRDSLASAINEAETGAIRLREAAETARPEIGWMRDAATEASDRIAQSAQAIAEQQDRFSALLASLDDGVGSAEARLANLASSIAEAQTEATRLSGETAPALVAAMVQVREAAAHAAERAREAIEAVIPEGAAKLSEKSRAALEQAISGEIEDRLREVDIIAAKAVEAARAASDRLTQQMLTLGQSAAALEQHIEATNSDQREKDSEAFARRVSLLIDSMHSSSIDVGKILSDEIDDKSWDSYLKGNRGVFTRRAVRLMGNSETRAIASHYETDIEFQRSVNHYVHDFEAMLRRVLAERDGGVIAVTLMSSDMGKLYAALSPAIDKKR